MQPAKQRTKQRSRATTCEAAANSLRCLTIVCVVAVCVVAAGCGSSSKSSSATTLPKHTFEVQTDDGQASLSLDGRLPPGWPSAFPTPKDSDPAGSGSLANTGAGGLVGVYATSKLPAEVYDFYKTKAPLTVTSSSSIGAGSAFVGTLKFGGSYSGSSVTIVSAKNDSKNKKYKTYFVVILKGTGASSSTTTTTSG
jgi:hypothetical protein